MSYNANFPADDSFLADFPPAMREQIRALVQDMVVNALKLQGLTPGNASGNIPIANGTKCINLNAELHGGNLPSAYAAAGHTHNAATTSSNGFMANTDKAKLDGIAAGAQVNQNAFGNIQVGSTTVQADSPTDTLELVAGTNIALTPDATNDRVTVAVTGTVAAAATAASCTGNAATATKLAAARTINGVAFDGTANITVADSTKAPVAHAAADTTYGVASASKYGHVKATSANPLPSGNASVGTDNGLYARGDHVHPAQTSVSGNAGTATKLATPRTIALTGAVTGSGSFDGSSNLSIATVSNINVQPHGKKLFTSSGTFTVPNGISTVWLTMCGGGGAGGSGFRYSDGDSFNFGGSGGGGGAAAVICREVTVNPGEVIPVTIGAGGIGAANKAGGAGGTTSFGSLLSCAGGGGGPASIAGGSSGGAGGSAGAPAPSTNVGGTGGGCMFGAGGAGGYSGKGSVSAGKAGTGYGSGGGGASGTNPGGNGAPGFILVEW